MSNPLFTGTEQETIFKAGLEIPPIPPGEILRDYEALRAWLKTAIVSITAQNTAMFSYTAGPVSSATADDRDKPRFLFNEAGMYIGVALFQPDIQAWGLAGVRGELKTMVRAATTVVADMEENFLAGWALADGTSTAIPNLTANTAFFQGSAPAWTLYTVGKFA